MTIRPYCPEDLQALLDITVLGFEPVCIDGSIERRFGALNGTDWRARKCQQIRDDIAADPEGVYVCEIDGDVVGYITSTLNHITRTGRIPNLATHPEHRRKGVARALIAVAMDRFRAAGMTHARIETLEQNEAGRSLYPSCGFVEIARQIHYLAKL